MENHNGISFVHAIQTRSGLDILKHNLLAAIEVHPWADKTLLEQNLRDHSTIFVPLYAIRYDWVKG